ncbi:hypothetical protein MKJ04_19285 [Pontibacter sp. E15-1]|uniref:hypothetical protein n=1 Tax=Pontibacter sp. E15-1 TaxID=2919918 RepID=UPI001F4FD31A|nr:hypothetical protein [Pontibacter sp. E15-1]MCJ8166994.1 hypothetical protein [Pontibacter sp. E15-1]
MKTFLSAVLVSLCLLVLAAGCSERNDPAPACLQAEVIGPDSCQPGWHILKLQDDATLTSSQSNSYIGQLHGGYVTASNLPQAYQQPGSRLNLTLEVDDSPTQVCVAVHILYPPVRVKRVCQAAAGDSD